MVDEVESRLDIGDVPEPSRAAFAADMRDTIDVYATSEVDDLLVVKANASDVSAALGLKVDRSNFRPIRQYTDTDLSMTYPEREVVGIGEGEHQAFGYVTLDPVTRIQYVCWRAGAIHGVAGAGAIRMRRYKNNGAHPVIEADGGGEYQIVLEPEAGRDLRDPSPCVDPATGNLIIVFDDVPTTGTTSTYFRKIISTDGGDTWGAPETFFTAISDYARVYNGLRVMPSTSPDHAYELVTCAYYSITADPTNIVDYFVSRDGGLTFQNSQALGEAYITSPSPGGASEVAICGVTSNLWFVVARQSDDLRIKWSTDGRQTWSAIETIDWSVIGVHVAPNAIVVNDAKGRPTLLIATSNRSIDQIGFSAALVSDILKYGQSALCEPKYLNATSNAYPSVVDFGNGECVFSFTREYSPATYASTHLGYFSYGEIVDRIPGFKINRSTNQTIPTATKTQVAWNEPGLGYLHGCLLESGGGIRIKRAGRWRFEFRARLSGGNVADAQYIAHITKDGADIGSDYSHVVSATGSTEVRCSVDANLPFDALITTHLTLAGAGDKVLSFSYQATHFSGTYLGEY